MKAQQQVVPRENPPASTMDSRLRDFMRMNPPVYTRSKIVEYLEEECREAMFHASMGLSRLMVHVQNVEENRNRKHTRAWNRSREVEKNFQGRVVLKSGISPGLQTDSSTKGSQVHPRIAMIGTQSLELRVGSVSNFIKESV